MTNFNIQSIAAAAESDFVLTEEELRAIMLATVFTSSDGQQYLNQPLSEQLDEIIGSYADQERGLMEDIRSQWNAGSRDTNGYMEHDLIINNTVDLNVDVHHVLNVTMTETVDINITHHFYPGDITEVVPADRILGDITVNDVVFHSEAFDPASLADVV